MRAGLLLPLVLLASLAAAEVPVAPLEVAPTRGNHLTPRIARDGDGYFAVWVDPREVNSWAVYGARIEADGTLLDPAGIRLMDSWEDVALGCGGGRCLVTAAGLPFVIVENGAVVASGKAIPEYMGAPHVVYNGRDFVVFYGSDTVRAVIIDRDGKVVAERFDVIPMRDGVAPHAVAFNGSRFVLLYARDHQLHKGVLDANARLLSTEMIDAEMVWPGGGAGTAAAIGTIGGEFAAVWRRTLTRTLVVARFDANGALAGAPVPLPSQYVSFDLAAGAADYTIYAVPHGEKQVVAIPLSRALAIGAAQPHFVPAPLSIEDVAAEGDILLALVADLSVDFASEIVALRSAGAPQSVTRAAPGQFAPRVAVGARGTLVAWSEYRGARHEARASLVARDRVTRTFALAPSDHDQRVTSVAVAGDTFLVAWTENGATRARIVRDVPAGERITLAEEGFALASGNGSDFVVAASNANRTSYELLLVSTGGEIVRRGATIAAKAERGTPPAALACGDDGECLFVWHDVVNGAPPRATLLAHRITSDAGLRDSAPFELATPPFSFTMMDVAAAADGAGKFAVAWIDGQMVKFRAIDGAALGNVFQREGEHPALAREGDAWVLWRDIGYDYDPQLTIVRFTSDAALFEAPYLRDRQSRSGAALARDGAKVIAAYQRTTRHEPAGGVLRVYLSEGDVRPPRRRAVGR